MWSILLTSIAAILFFTQKQHGVFGSKMAPGFRLQQVRILSRWSILLKTIAAILVAIFAAILLSTFDAILLLTGILFFTFDAILFWPPSCFRPANFDDILGFDYLTYLFCHVVSTTLRAFFFRVFRLPQLVILSGGGPKAP